MNTISVSALIAKLKEFEPNLPVVVQGYEGGFDDVTSASKISIQLDANQEDYMGRHEQAGDKPGQPAILLISNRRQ